MIWNNNSEISPQVRIHHYSSRKSRLSTFGVTSVDQYSLSEVRYKSLMAVLSLSLLQMAYLLCLSPSAPWPWLAWWQWSLTRWVGTWDGWPLSLHWFACAWEGHNCTWSKTHLSKGNVSKCCLFSGLKGHGLLPIQPMKTKGQTDMIDTAMRHLIAIHLIGRDVNCRIDLTNLMRKVLF